MTDRRRYAVRCGGLLLVSASLACGVSRDQDYFKLLGQFQQAESRPAAQAGTGTPASRFTVPLPGQAVTATIIGREGLDVIRVHYSDESDPRTLYEYVDYSNPIDVRVDHTTLYVYWSETLVGSKSYVLAYDLAGRRLVAKRRVDPKDVARP